MSIGFVYCITNSYMPGLCKIGMTDRSPSQRVKELSSSTSVPDGFDIQFYAEVENAHDVERALHEFFKDERVNEYREFFRIKPIDVYKAIVNMDVVLTCHLDGGLIFDLSAERGRSEVAQ